MIEDVRVVAFGRPATRALATAVGRAKQAGALAPVTVIVPSNLAGVTARRLLGAGVIESVRGIANVNFVTPLRLAQLLADGQLTETVPLTNPVLGAAVRRALADAPGPFAAVADHHATEAALAQLYAELSSVSAPARAAMAAGGGRRAGDALRIFDTIARALDGFHDEAAVAQAARTRADLAGAIAPLGVIVWYLPEPAGAALVDLVGAVLSHARSTVIVGLTGDDSADAAVRTTCARAGVDLGVVAAPVTRAGVQPVADRIVSVTDADEEVRAVVRRVVTFVEDGVALDRVGVFYPVADPYVALLDEHLAGAGIPANGPARGRLATTAAGRTLLAALELPRERWRRDRVVALVNGGPVCHGDGYAHPSAWDEVSRRAGVIGGLDDWRRKLAARQKRVEALQVEAGATDTARHQRAERELSHLAELRAFVDELARRVGVVDTADGWRAKSDAARELLHGLLGPGHRHGSWPDAEQVAFDRVEDALARLATLDSIEPHPSRDVFVRALAAELDVARGRAGRFGYGLVYGPLAAAAGHDLDAVFVLGCTEGLCPAPRRDDGLLPDSVRQLTSGELALRSDRLHEQHRLFLAALAAAPPGRRVLTFPRGDLRSSRVSLPSRWLLDTASALAGVRVHATDFAALDAPIVEHVASHARGVLDALVHGSLAERDVAVVAAHVAAGGAAVDHPDAAAAARGIAAQVARRSSLFTEWDGNLAGQPIRVGSEPQSPTRLEAWSACGMRYFLAHVLGLADRDDPERIIELDALGRGSAIHDVLERFFGEMIAAGSPRPGERWTAAQRARLGAIANDVFDEYERRGVTGRPVHWRMTRGDLVALLDNFLIVDETFRAASGARPERVELPFGMEGEAPVTLTLDGGRMVAFRGRADRVDRLRDADGGEFTGEFTGERGGERGGGRVLVSDYKTGRSDRYRGIDVGDPVSGGTMLQLGLYAEAALARGDAAHASAHYWMVSGDGADGGRYGYDWTSERRARLVGVLSTIVDGIEAGVFAATPGDWDIFRHTHQSCAHCTFDTVCVRDRGEHADVKSASVELRARDGLAWQAS